MVEMVYGMRGERGRGEKDRRFTFAGGRGRVLEIQASATTYPVYTPAGINIIARYLGPTVVVVAATAVSSVQPFRRYAWIF